jgi:putative peptide zinc metalloprotease protein
VVFPAVSAEAFLSASWYRLAQLKPALKPQAKVRRHRFRGAVWYVVQDTASGRFNRFTPAAWQLLGLMDGRRTMDDVWAEAVEQLGDDAPGQEEVIRLLSQLHAADLLHCEVNPDSAELFERHGKQEQTRKGARWKNPFSIRIPLWDPDRFLTRSLPYVRPLFGPLGVIAFLLLAVFALVLAAVHFPELTQNLDDRVLSAQNLLLLWLCFPAVKFLHELGHAYAVKAGGGEVHEMGVLLLVFMPVPYVEASAASGFRNKWRRTGVGAAGMLVELYLSALAMLVWSAAEPGLVRAVAFNVMLIAGVSTLVFNANPLLRFDGYYILSDLIEMPNMAERGNRYWRYLSERYLFRMRDAEPPILTAGERNWLRVFTPLSFAYRMTVLVAIVAYVAGAWFFIGVVLAIWGVVTMLGMPLAKTGRYLAGLPRAQGARRRAAVVVGVLASAVVLFVLAVPVPMRTQTEGVVWLPDEAQVRAGASGFIRAVLAAPGAPLQPGTPLLETQDPAMAAQIALGEAKLEELEARLDAQRFDDRAQAELTRQDIAREAAALERLRQREDQLTVRSAATGRFVIDRPDDLPGRFVRKGDLVGYVAQDSRTLVRAVVSQDDIDLVRAGPVRIEVRLAEETAIVHVARLVREVPAARDELPSAALTSQGGGAIAPDPRDPQGAKALASSFQIDLELPADVTSASYGGRAYVRFTHAPRPLGVQWYRRLRQVFLQRFNV